MCVSSDAWLCARRGGGPNVWPSAPSSTLAGYLQMVRALVHYYLPCVSARGRRPGGYVARATIMRVRPMRSGGFAHIASQYLRALQRGPVCPRQALAGTSYATLMDQLAVSACPGADSARAFSRRRWIHPVREFVLTHTERRGWITLRSLETSLRSTGRVDSPR